MFRARLPLHISLLCCLVVPMKAMAQAGVASLSGLITDPSGAVVPLLQVTEINEETHISRITRTDHAGYYTFVGLPVGNYRVTVSAPGFQEQTFTTTLDPSENARLDFHLRVAGAAAQVEVSAQIVELQRDDASIGTVIDQQTIQGTPLFQRNWDDLIRLVPGVQAQRFTQQSGSSTSGSTGLFVIHGIGNEQNNYILDGIDNNTFSENLQELSASAARPSVDVIGEFKLISNAYTAVYGRSPGAVIDVTTKGGTDRFHGLLFEYLRNRVFDANDYFSNQSGLPKPKEIQNQFGGNFGGPIIRRKLFGFFNFEGTRIRQGITRLYTVPLANERAGDFSPAAAAANGVTYATIKDPATGIPYANNKVPTSAIDPFGQKILNAFPNANLPGAVNNFARTGSLLDDNNSYDARVDYDPNSNNLFFARYTASSRVRDVPGYFGGIADGSSTSSWGNSTLKSWAAVLGWTHIISSRMTNDFRLGFVRNFATDQQQPFGLNKNSDYIPGVPDNPATQGGIGLTQYTGLTFIGSPGYLPKQQVPQQWQFTDTLSITRGAHFIRTGVDLRMPMRNLYKDESGSNGGLTFNGSFTGNPYADGLTGYVFQGSLSNVYFVDQRLWMASGFAQDDWKITRKLTLNLGLRYDFATPPYSAKNQLANFDPSGSGSIIRAKAGSIEDRSVVQVNTTNFAPRVGAAYALDDKTVLRGGYGLYYLLFKRNGSEDQLALNPPFLLSSTLNSNGKNPAFFLKNGFPGGLLDPNNVNYSLTHIHAMQYDSPTPKTQAWSFGFQRALPGQMVLTADYVGTRSDSLDIINDLNQYVPNTKIQPYPNFGYLEFSHAVGMSHYSGLEVGLQRRSTHGLTLQLAYTHSKATSTSYTTTFVDALSGSDVPDHVVGSYVYELPFGHNKSMLNSGIGSALLGGWRTSGVYSYSTGLPFSVTLGGNYNSAIDINGNGTAMPNLVGTPKIVGNVKCWFYYSANKSCQALSPSTADAYALPPTGVPSGNNGLNTLRGPHTSVFDFGLMRDFGITERANLQFRWEVFNLTNSTLFAQPSASLTSSSVGTITSLAGDPRIMQFALRLSF